MFVRTLILAALVCFHALTSVAMPVPTITSLHAIPPRDLNTLRVYQSIADQKIWLDFGTAQFEMLALKEAPGFFIKKISLSDLDHEIFQHEERYSSLMVIDLPMDSEIFKSHIHFFDQHNRQSAELTDLVLDLKDESKGARYITSSPTRENIKQLSYQFGVSLLAAWGTMGFYSVLSPGFPHLMNSFLLGTISGGIVYSYGVKEKQWHVHPVWNRWAVKPFRNYSTLALGYSSTLLPLACAHILTRIGVL